MFDEILKKRRSIRKYKDEKIKDEEMKQILEAGLYSPSGRGANHWQFVVLADEKDKEKASLAKSPNPQCVKNASHVVIFAGDKLNREATCTDDLSIAATIMQLKATELGIGSCWIHIGENNFDENTRSSDYLKKTFGIPENYEIEMMMTFGYPDEEKDEKTPAEFSEHVHFDKF